MEFVSDEVIDQSTEELHSLDENQLQDLINTMSAEQPYLLSYLMGVENDALDNDEREVLLFMGVNIWNAVKKVQPDSLPKITSESIDEAEDHNQKMLEYFMEESDEGFIQNVYNLMESYAQSPLLTYVVTAIMEEENEEEEPLISEENKGLLFFLLKTFIDSMDESYKEKQKS